MDNEGSLYVVWLNKGESREPVFAVRFAPNGYGTVDGVTTRQFLGEESLREFLARSLFIESNHVEDALLDLHNKGSAEIHSLNISDDDFWGQSTADANPLS
jgi:hypothetical protein